MTAVEFLITSATLSFCISYAIAIIYAFEYSTSNIEKIIPNKLIWVFILSILIHIVIMANCFTLID